MSISSCWPIAGVIGTVAFAVEGRLAVAIGVGLIAAFAVAARRWFRWRMDAQLSARDAGDAEVARAPAALEAACCAMRSSLSRSWPAFPMSVSRRLDQDRRRPYCRNSLVNSPMPPIATVTVLTAPS